MDNSQTEQDENTVFLIVPGKAGRTIKSGDILGDNYRLMDLIGRGGMGVVYRCQHQIIGREYALKILSPDQVNEQSWLRFQVEGKAIAKLDHANIVKIFNMGVDGQDCPYYVMELLDGDSLETYTKTRGFVGIAETLDIFSQVAAGLSYAHSKGIVHRDIKPSNIILQNNKGTVKIVDFGLVKLVDTHALTEQRLTSDGEVIGSPYYMSPEQGMGTNIDARSDIYSMGCALFKTLTGKPPFSGESAFSTVMMHQSQPAPSLASAAKGASFPQALEDLVQKMIAKRPEDRYQSMDQLMHDLSRLQQGKTLAKRGTNQTIDRSDGDDEVVVPAGPKQDLASASRPAAATAFLIAIPVIGAAIVCGALARWGHAPGTTGGALQKSSGEKPLAVSATTEVKDGGAGLRDIAMEKARADFGRFERQNTQLINDLGVKSFQFSFPDTAIGALGNGANDGYPAQKTVLLQQTRSIYLKIDVANNRFTWANPWILSKIDSTGIRVLVLTDGDSYLEGLPKLANQDNSEKPILEMLSIVQDWKDLEQIHFVETKISPSIVAAIDRLPRIAGIKCNSCSDTHKFLAQYPRLLSRLRVLALSDAKDVDPVLLLLQNSTKLRRLVINSTDPSPQAISALSTCPNLNHLAIEGQALNDDYLIALSRLPSLQHLFLGRDSLPPDAVSRLTMLKNLTDLHISRTGLSDDQIIALKKALPKCAIELEDRRKSDFYEPN